MASSSQQKGKSKPVNKPLPTEAGFPESGDTSGWEFPGGKIEDAYVHDDDTLRYDNDDRGKWIPSETPKDALKREISEELATAIEVGDLFTTVEYDYAKFHLTMHCYLCSLIGGQLSLLEHKVHVCLQRMTSIP